MYKEKMDVTNTMNEKPLTDIEKIQEDLALPDPNTYTELLDVFKKWLILDDPEIIKIICACMFANRLPGDPLWLFIIAPPGGSKTEILSSLTGEFAVTVSTLTEHSLISGLRQGKNPIDPSLIPKLDGKVLIIKDFSAILSMRRESREEILSTLRDAYDGECSKAFGSNVGTVRYKSKFGLIAAATPIIDRFYSIEQQLGERFLKARIRSLNPDKVVTKSLANLGKEKIMRRELATAMQAILLKTLVINNEPKFDPGIQEQLIALASLLALFRSGVSRNPYDNTIDFVPEAEIGTRLVKQLSKIAIGLAIVDKREIVSQDDYQIAKRVALDTLPSKKKAIIDALITLKIRNGDMYFTSQDIGNISDFPTETCKIILEDLRILNVILRTGTNRFSWKLNQRICDLLEKAQI